MVLDFVNDPEDVQKDFQEYYGKNFIAEENLTDPNSLYYVLNTVENYDIIYDQEIEAFAKIFFTTVDDFEKLQPILKTVRDRFEEVLNDEDKSSFKSSAQSFTRLYRFLSQIMTFTDVELEKKYVFLTALLKVLPYVKQDLPLDVVNDVELDSYKIQHSYTTNLSLESGDGELEGMSPGASGSSAEDDIDYLTKIIKVLNDTFGLELTPEDKVEFNRMKKRVHSNEELMAFFNNRNSKGNIKDKFDDTINEELMTFINDKLDFYNKMTEDNVNAMFKKMWFNEIYDSRVRGIGK
jgi:type I restriction enzyme R subunit